MYLIGADPDGEGSSKLKLLGCDQGRAGSASCLPCNDMSKREFPTSSPLDTYSRKEKPPEWDNWPCPSLAAILSRKVSALPLCGRVELVLILGVVGE